MNLLQVRRSGLEPEISEDDGVTARCDTNSAHRRMSGWSWSRTKRAYDKRFTVSPATSTE